MALGSTFQTEIEHKSFLDALKLLDEVPGRTGYLSSYAIRMQFEGTRLRMFLSSEVSGEVLVACKAAQKQELFIDRRLLLPFLTAKVSDAPFILSYDGTELTVRQGRRKAKFSPLAPVQGYTDCPSLGKATVVDIAETTEQIKAAASCAVNDPMFPHYSAVHIVKDTASHVVMSTNQVVGFGAFFRKKGYATFAFPMSLIGLLGRDDIEKCYILSDAIVLKFGQGTIWQSYSVKNAKFPSDNLMAFFNSKSSVVFTLATKDLSKILDRLSLYLSGVDKGDWEVTFFGKAGEQKVAVKAEVQQAVFAEALPLITAAADDFSVVWPLAKVLEPLLYMCKQATEVSVQEFSNDPGKSSGYLIKAGQVSLAVAKKPKAK
jgi:hypothetical protein